MPIYPNMTPWSDVTTTTRENRSAEHGNLFSKTDPSKVNKAPRSPVHPILPEGKPNWNGKYAIRGPKRRK